MEDRAIEYVDHLHEHFVDPVQDLPRDGTCHRRRPACPPSSVSASIAEFTFPTGPTWADVGIARAERWIRAARRDGGQPTRRRHVR